MSEGCKVVERRHVIEAIEKHCKTIQRQILEHKMSERGKFLEIKPEGVKIGQIYEHSIDVRDYKIKVVPGETLDDYLRECLAEESKIRIPVKNA